MTPLEAMTDRELLELAAKAAGINYQRCCRSYFIDGVTYPQWNPLDDDGDALRLAVKLRLCVDNCVGEEGDRNECSVGNEVGSVGAVFTDVDYGGDPYAATRRAIVRAAAEIGKEMK